jgi:predicted nucleotidyltransferase
MADMLAHRRAAFTAAPTGPRVPPATAQASILVAMEAQLDKASLSGAERRTIRRFLDSLAGALGPDLQAVWLYGSRARGERRPDSDIDLMVIAEGDTRAAQRLALDLSEAAALAEREDPFTYSVAVHDRAWLDGRRRIESFFVAEVDRDKLVLAGGTLATGRAGR